MRWFQKKRDPLDARSDELRRKIRELEREMRQAAHAPPSTSAPDGPSLRKGVPPPDPVFESIEPASRPAEVAPPEQFNQMGVRKFDLAAAWKRVRRLWERPGSTTNPRLIEYLAAGSMKGLRPLRYERRVARNRLIFLFLVVLAILGAFTGLFWR